MLPLLHTATGPYQFHWPLHADVVLFCLALELGYLYVVTQLRGAVSDAGRVRRSQAWLFTAGVVSLYLVAGTPVHDISEQYLLSMHMTQHTVFVLVAAPLLLAGTPAWVWEALLRQRALMPVARVMVRPLFAFGLFNAITVMTHMPFAVDYSLNHHWFHFVVHALLVSSAMLMWWPILSVVPALPRISPMAQIAYLFLQSLVPTVIAAFVTFADNSVYSFYDRAPRIWGLSPMEDQQIAGGVMKLLGSLIIWTFIAVIFFQWYAREQKQEAEPRWDEVEEELKELGLTPGEQR
jgi:putative membrane protein